MSSEATPHAEGGQTAGSGRSRCSLCEHPLSSALAVFGLGLGTGVLLGTALFGSPRHRTDRAARRSAQDLFDALASIVPEYVSKHKP